MEKGIKDLLIDELHDILSCEEQIIEALPSMVSAANSPELKNAFATHLKETKGQVVRLNKIFKLLKVKKEEKFCKAAKGLISECKDVLKEFRKKSPLRDAALISKAQRIEHYEIAAYGTVRTFANEIDQDEVSDLLQANLNEEGNADKLLTKIAEGGLLRSGINHIANVISENSARKTAEKKSAQAKSGKAKSKKASTASTKKSSSTAKKTSSKTAKKASTKTAKKISAAKKTTATTTKKAPAKTAKKAPAKTAKKTISSDPKKRTTAAKKTGTAHSKTHAKTPAKTSSSRSKPATKAAKKHATKSHSATSSAKKASSSRATASKTNSHKAKSASAPKHFSFPAKRPAAAKSPALRR